MYASFEMKTNPESEIHTENMNMLENAKNTKLNNGYTS